jgi:hypothetical protein
MSKIANKFKEGDLVYHRSNPTFKMVLNFVDEDEDEDGEKYQCTWIDSTGKMQNESFASFELEKSITL